MKTRTLGRGGPTISAIGLGCMRMSSFAGAPTDPDPDSDKESVATIEAALDAGITLLDTGDFYGMGHNETLVGRALKRRRDRAFVSVKFGAQWAPSGAFLGADCRPNSVKNFASYSLRRLGVDVIDLYQPGRADPAVPFEDTVGAVADLIKEGKVRYLGVSEVNADQLRRAHRTHPVAALEIEYSLATRFIEREILPTARELGIGVVAYGVVSHGLLSGKFKRGVPQAAFAGLDRLQGENLVRNLQTVEILEKMASEMAVTTAQLALAWVLSRGDDIVPLIGMSRRSRLLENLGALNIALSQGDLTTLDRVFAPGAILGHRSPQQVSSANSRRAACSGSSVASISPFGMDHTPSPFFLQNGPPGWTRSTSR